MTNRPALDAEVKSRIQFRVYSLRQASTENNFYNLMINTPEFSRFVFLVPASFLLGMTFASVSSAASPLMFEKMIPYQIRTIAFSTCFHSFVDLAVNVLGRPLIDSHHGTTSKFLYAYLSLMASAGVVSLADHNPHDAYKATLALLALHAFPVSLLPMPAWVRLWRMGFLVLSGVSSLTASRKLEYLEEHWDDVVFAQYSLNSG